PRCDPAHHQERRVDASEGSLRTIVDGQERGLVGVFVLGCVWIRHGFLPAKGVPSPRSPSRQGIPCAVAPYSPFGRVPPRGTPSSWGVFTVSIHHARGYTGRGRGEGSSTRTPMAHA